MYSIINRYIHKYFYIFNPYYAKYTILCLSIDLIREQKIVYIDIICSKDNIKVHKDFIFHCLGISSIIIMMILIQNKIVILRLPLLL